MQTATLYAYDVGGQLIGQDTETDTGGETFTISVPNIHSVKFSGVNSPNGSVAGIALDDFTYHYVMPLNLAVRTIKRTTGYGGGHVRSIGSGQAPAPDAVPEPSALALLAGVGLTGTVFFRKRRCSHMPNGGRTTCLNNN